MSSKCQEQLSSLPCLLPLGPHPMVASPCPLATACLLPHYPYIVTLSPTYRFLPEPQYTLTTLYKLPCAASTSSRVTLALCPSLPTLASALDPRPSQRMLPSQPRERGLSLTSPRPQSVLFLDLNPSPTGWDPRPQFPRK